jgi:hypothetical protein
MVGGIEFNVINFFVNVRLISYCVSQMFGLCLIVEP